MHHSRFLCLSFDLPLRKRVLAVIYSQSFSWGMPLDLFHPLPAREFSRCYHEIGGRPSHLSRYFLPLLYAARLSPPHKTEHNLPGDKQQEIRVRGQAKRRRKGQVEVAEYPVGNRQHTYPPPVLTHEQPTKQDKAGIKESVAQPIAERERHSPDRPLVGISGGQRVEEDVLQGIACEYECHAGDPQDERDAGPRLVPSHLARDEDKHDERRDRRSDTQYVVECT